MRFMMLVTDMKGQPIIFNKLHLFSLITTDFVRGTGAHHCDAQRGHLVLLKIQ